MRANILLQNFLSSQAIINLYWNITVADRAAESHAAGAFYSNLDTNACTNKRIKISPCARFFMNVCRCFRGRYCRHHASGALGVCINYCGAYQITSAGEKSVHGKCNTAGKTYEKVRRNEIGTSQSFLGCLVHLLMGIA